MSVIDKLVENQLGNLMYIDLSCQFEILSLPTDQACHEMCHALNKQLGLSPDEAFKRRSELFSFSRDEFDAWCNDVDVNKFAKTYPSRGDDLYILQEPSGDFIVFWQEREIRDDIKKFKTFQEAKIMAIEMRVKYLIGG